MDALFFAGGVTRELDALAAEVRMPMMLGGGGGD